MTRKEEQWRNEGAAFCLRFLENNNNDVEALKAELKRRGIFGVPLVLSKAEEIDYCTKVRENCIDTIGLLSLGVLHDTFGFGPKRARQFMDAFVKGGDLLGADLMYWSDLQKGVKEELGLDIMIRWNGKNPQAADKGATE